MCMLLIRLGEADVPTAFSVRVERSRDTSEVETRVERGRSLDAPPLSTGPLDFARGKR